MCCVFCLNVFLLSFALCRPENSSLRNFGTNWPAVWVKMASSWICILIYAGSLFLPCCVSDPEEWDMFTLQRRPQNKKQQNGEDVEGGVEGEEALQLSPPHGLEQEEEPGHRHRHKSR